MSANSLPPGHSLIETLDGSYTLFSEAFQEACHSTNGAKEETLLHYIGGCKILERLSDVDPFIILEVGFGLGVGFLTTYEVLPKNKNYHFVSLEIDRGLLNWFKEINQNHPLLSKLAWKEINGISYLEAKSEFITLIILQGDARETLPAFMVDKSFKWHAIYQDAFSPKKNPRLWTKEWFHFLKSQSHESVILSTYSASTSIRKSLDESGWSLHKGEKFGPKKTSTRASLTGLSDPEILEHLKRSPTSSISDDTIEEFLGNKK